MKTAELVKQFKNDPAKQREAFHQWSLLDGSEGQITALHQSDSLAARLALRLSLDAIYQNMAMAEETGISMLKKSCPWILKDQA